MWSARNALTPSSMSRSTGVAGTAFTATRVYAIRLTSTLPGSLERGPACRRHPTRYFQGLAPQGYSTHRATLDGQTEFAKERGLKASMPDYDFRPLSPTDFEHLSRDVLNADLGLRLQSYPAGRDKGIDLRQADADGQTIVAQCKHYPESSPSTFLDAVAKEGKRGKSLTVNRYLFVTSRPITAHQQDEILTKLQGLPVAKDDIWGREALNAALGRHPEVERQHIKLWISSTEVLDTLINSGQWQRGKALLANLAERARLWVRTPAYDAVLDMLEKEGVCILTGPPGVGKTFLSEMA